jgi:hypothetical protein
LTTKYRNPVLRGAIGAREGRPLWRRGDDFEIRADNYELMNSRSHGSEEALARIAYSRVAPRCSSWSAGSASAAGSPPRDGTSERIAA